jgi:hypothetical protein
LPIVGVFNSLTTGLVVKPNYKWENHNTVEELTVRVNNAAESIGRNSDMLVRTQASMTQRAQVCIDNGGRHFEFSNIEFEG